MSQEKAKELAVELKAASQETGFGGVNKPFPSAIVKFPSDLKGVGVNEILTVLNSDGEKDNNWRARSAHPTQLTKETQQLLRDAGVPELMEGISFFPS